MTLGSGTAFLVWLLVGVLVVATATLAALWWRRFRSADEAATSDREPATTPEPESGSEGTTDGESASSPTDEELIREMLRDGDGWLWQGDIGDRTGWSKAKVSRVLSRMEQRDQVTKISIGRENIVAIPGSEPEAARLE